jgi:hypothetical protein
MALMYLLDLKQVCVPAAYRMLAAHHRQHSRFLIKTDLNQRFDDLNTILFSASFACEKKSESRRAELGMISPQA